jgi:PadR family transcriptional regulator, regulatory protein AphA
MNHSVLVDISFAILAFLAAGPRSGYDLKKLFSESESLHWSGNNNQIYAALVKIHRGGLAEVEFQQPGEGPARKLYCITPAGIEALKEWLSSEPGQPQIRLPIVVHLMAADLLNETELEQLLGDYEEHIRLKLAGLEELQRRDKGPSFGSERQRAIWQAINDRPIGIYRAEEEWVRNLRWAVANIERKARN